MKKIISFVFTILFCFASSAFCATYYVDQTSGSDYNTGFGTYVSGVFSDSRTINIGIGESVFIAFLLTRQCSEKGDPYHWRLIYQIDYPASTNYYGAYAGLVGNDPYYAIFEI